MRLQEFDAYLATYVDGRVTESLVILARSAKEATDIALSDEGTQNGLRTLERFEKLGQGVAPVTETAPTSSGPA